jgi:hypothetical protein
MNSTGGKNNEKDGIPHTEKICSDFEMLKD